MAMQTMGSSSTTRTRVMLAPDAECVFDVSFIPESHRGASEPFLFLVWARVLVDAMSRSSRPASGRRRQIARHLLAAQPVSAPFLDSFDGIALPCDPNCAFATAARVAAFL